MAASNVDWENALEHMYFTPGENAAFSSVDKLKRHLQKLGYKISRIKIKKWLNEKYTYVIHRHRRKTFPRNPIIAQYIDHNWQADILFLNDIASFNDRKTCILLCIDVVSRYAWGQPMLTKKGVDTTKAFDKILTLSGRKPEKLQTDKGVEFYNKDFKTLLKKHNIALYSTESDKKAAIAERCIKEIKKLIYHYMTANQTNRYIDVLQDLLKTYNSTYHSSIQRAPADVNEQNQGEVLEALYGKLWANDRLPRLSKIKTRQTKFQPGDKVRISLSSDMFTKGYKGFWTTEIFTVASVKRSYPYVQYQLKDTDGDLVKGLFYTQELQRAHEKSQKYTRIKKILKRKYIKGKLWFLVNWEDEPETLKRWVRASTIH